MQRYTYAGPVMEFSNLLMTKWEASTYASSKEKAKSNLTYQFKKKFNRLPNAKITLTGEIIAE